MELHPYDGVERRYTDVDADTTSGRAVIGQILGIETPLPDPELRYDLSIYSGGIGVFDNIAISFPYSTDAWRQVVGTFDARRPEELACDDEWGDQFQWLIIGRSGRTDIHRAAIAFVLSERKLFQPQCVDTSDLRFGSGSDVNDWSAMWTHDGKIAYLGFSQG